MVSVVSYSVLSVIVAGRAFPFVLFKQMKMANLAFKRVHGLEACVTHKLFQPEILIYGFG